MSRSVGIMSKTRQDNRYNVRPSVSIIILYHKPATFAALWNRNEASFAKNPGTTVAIYAVGEKRGSPEMAFVNKAGVCQHATDTHLVCNVATSRAIARTSIKVGSVHQN